MDNVFKKIHEDGSETVIKQVKSAFRTGGGDYKERDEVVTSIFISSSTGCPKKCVFCHLTEMNMPFKKLKSHQISDNVLDAIDECEFVSTKNKFKLCWMGMGDPLVNPTTTIQVSKILITHLMVTEIDISTIIPDEAKLGAVERHLAKKERIPVRLFYSLHTGNAVNRDLIIPSGGDINKHIFAMQCWGGEKFIHYTPVKGLNDSVLDVLSIAKASKEIGSCNIRMLEFNPHADSLYERPSREHLSKLYSLFNKQGVSVKWQVSKGKEELAACGQFHDPI